MKRQMTKHLKIAKMTIVKHIDNEVEMAYKYNTQRITTTMCDSVTHKMKQNETEHAKFIYFHSNVELTIFP